MEQRVFLPPLHSNTPEMSTEEKKARTLSKQQFTRAESSLRSALSENVDEWTIATRYEALKGRWDKVQDAHDLYVLTLEDAKAEEEAPWIADLETRFNAIELQVGKVMVLRKAAINEPGTNDKESTVDVQPDAKTVSATNVVQRGIKMETLKFTVFKGDLRRYPEFKSEFVKYIQPRCQADQLTFVLKSYLDETVKEEVRNVGDNYGDMWERLDAKYGNVRRLVDTILSDVKKLQQNSGDPSDALKMINIVEKAWRDLKALGQSSELYNSTTISIIEQAMSPKMKDEWVKIIASRSFDSQQAFYSLLELMKDWRNRLEYLASEIREEEAIATQHKGGAHQVSESNARDSTRRRRCWLHNIDGSAGKHHIWRCRLFRSKNVAERKALVYANNACVRCLKTGCPGLKDIDSCPQTYICTEPGCGKKHNSLLHEDVAIVNHSNQCPKETVNTPLLPIQELETP